MRTDMKAGLTVEELAQEFPVAPTMNTGAVVAGDFVAVDPASSP